MEALLESLAENGFDRERFEAHWNTIRKTAQSFLDALGDASLQGLFETIEIAPADEGMTPASPHDDNSGKNKGLKIVKNDDSEAEEK